MPHLDSLENGLTIFLILLVFGAGKLPEIFGGAGKAMYEFRKGKTEEENAAVEPKE